MVIAATPVTPAAFCVADDLSTRPSIRPVRRPVSNCAIFTAGRAKSWACNFRASGEK